MADPATVKGEKAAQENPAFNDPSFVKGLMDELDIDKNDPELQKLLEGMGEEGKKKEDKGKEDKK